MALGYLQNPDHPDSRLTTSLQLPAPQDIHAAIRDALDPVVRPLGYVGTKGRAAGWSLKENRGRLFFQFQLHPKAKDSYAGGEFIIEFEHTLGESQGRALSGRARFDQLITSAELKAVLAHQNDVIGSLPRPPESHVASYPEFLRDTYMESFEPQGKFSPGNLWLRYRTLDDLRRWLHLISGILPSALDRAKRLDPHVIYMGSAIDLEADPLRPTNPLVITQTPEE
jgi:hypothetical protein